MQNGKNPQTKSKIDRVEFPIRRFPSPENQRKYKFRKLLETVGLLFLQLVSLATTLDGAKLLFRDESMPFVQWLPIAYLLGFGIQLLLTSILVFNAFEEKPVRRLLALLLLTAFSIYTNFFSIYNIFNGGLLEQNTSIDLARRKYENLVAYFYTNPKNELIKLEQKADELKCRLYQEDPRGTPQPKGCPNLGFDEGKGPDYDGYKADLDEVNKELSGLNQDYINNTAPKYFNLKITESLEDKDARDIFDLSQEALKEIPSQIENEALAKGYQPEEYDDVTDFFAKKGTSNFLIPGQKVFTSKENRETEAVIAFIAATVIDVIALLLGAKLNGFYTSLKKSFGSINPLADILNGSFAYLEDIATATVPFIEAPLVYGGKIWFSLADGGGALITSVFNGLAVILSSLLNGLFGLIVNIITDFHDLLPGKKKTLRVNRDAVEFLDIFYNAIVRQKSQELDGDSKNFQLYKVLMIDLKEKGYCEDSSATNNTRSYSQPNLILKPQRQKAFHDWYVHQRNLQLERQSKPNVSLYSIDFPPDI